VSTDRSTAALTGRLRSAISLVIVVEGTRGIDFPFGVIIAVVTANRVRWSFHLAQHTWFYC
jgi:hypothetical protein